MSKLIAFVSLVAASTSAMAVGTVPTPEVVPLIGAGVLAVVMARRLRK